MATEAEQLASVQAAIAATEKGQKWKHGDDENEMPNLDTLYDREENLKNSIARSGAGINVRRVRLSHG